MHEQHPVAWCTCDLAMLSVGKRVSPVVVMLKPADHVSSSGGTNSWLSIPVLVSRSCCSRHQTQTPPASLRRISGPNHMRVRAPGFRGGGTGARYRVVEQWAHPVSRLLSTPIPGLELLGVSDWRVGHYQFCAGQATVVTFPLRLSHGKN